MTRPNRLPARHVHGHCRADTNVCFVGAIVLEDLDLLVDCQRQRVVPRDARRAIYEIE